MVTSVQKIISWLENDLGKIWEFELDKSNFLTSVLEETPKEIVRVLSQLKSEKNITIQIDFVAGYLTSFIFY